MGLDTTHNCWHGSYSSFNRFRYSLAEEIGINLDEYTGYCAEGKDLASIDHGLQPLFDHSDCDGELTVEESKQIVNGLNDVLGNLKEGVEEYFKDCIIQFRDGLEDAIASNEVVEFH